MKCKKTTPKTTERKQSGIIIKNSSKKRLEESIQLRRNPIMEVFKRADKKQILEAMTKTMKHKKSIDVMINTLTNKGMFDGWVL